MHQGMNNSAIGRLNAVVEWCRLSCPQQQQLTSYHNNQLELSRNHEDQQTKSVENLE